MCSAAGGTISNRPAPPDTEALIFYLITSTSFLCHALPQSALGGRIRKTKAARRPRFADSRPFPEEHPRQSPASEAASASISS